MFRGREDTTVLYIFTPLPTQRARCVHLKVLQLQFIAFAQAPLASQMLSSPLYWERAFQLQNYCLRRCGSACPAGMQRSVPSDLKSQCVEGQADLQGSTAWPPDKQNLLPKNITCDV